MRVTETRTGAAEDDATRQAIRELAAAVSTQAQVANRIWLGLMTVALVALLRSSTTRAQVDLPFGLGQVEAMGFFVIVYFMLAVLTIAFSSAYVQQFRAQALAHSFLDTLPASPRYYAGIHPRKWFDILRLPTFNRVAPLPQSVKGQSMFAGVIRVGYYSVLKIAGLAVYFGLPAYALERAYEKTVFVGLPKWPMRLITVLAMLTLVQATLEDVFAFKKVFPKIWRPDRGEAS